MEGFFTYISRRENQGVIQEIIGEKYYYRVCCFCRSYKKFLLWSYYTNKHRGVCLEYDVDKTNLPPGCTIKPVNYTKTLPFFNPAGNIQDQAQTFLLTKLNVWKQESEVRLLGHDLPQNTVRIGKLTGIIFGVNFVVSDPDDELRQRVRRTILNGCYPPKLYNAVIESNIPTISRQIINRND